MRERIDSNLSDVYDEFRDYKKLKVDSEGKWAKVNKLISKDFTQLVLFEVPRGVSMSAIAFNVFNLIHVLNNSTILKSLIILKMASLTLKKELKRQLPKANRLYTHKSNLQRVLEQMRQLIKFWE